MMRPRTQNKIQQIQKAGKGTGESTGAFAFWPTMSFHPCRLSKLLQNSATVFRWIMAVNFIPSPFSASLQTTWKHGKDARQQKMLPGFAKLPLPLSWESHQWGICHPPQPRSSMAFWRSWTTSGCHLSLPDPSISSTCGKGLWGLVPDWMLKKWERQISVLLWGNKRK